MRGTVYDNRSHDTKANLVVVAICSAGFYSCRSRLQTLEMNLTISERASGRGETKIERCGDSDTPQHTQAVSRCPLHLYRFLMGQVVNLI